MSCCGTCGSVTCTCTPLSRVVPGVGAETSTQQRLLESESIELCGTLGRTLIPTADIIRNLYTQFGLRPYNINLVRTRWSTGFRSRATELVVSSTPLLPTPRVSDMSAVTEIVTPIGLDEFGEILLSEVSGAYTEDELRGANKYGDPVAHSDNFYYEIEFPPPCTGQEGERRRFTLRGAPMYFADRFQWNIRLTRQREDRARNGDPR